MMARLLVNDVSSTSGCNLRFIQNLTGLDPLTETGIKLKEKLEETRMTPEDEMWKSKILHKLVGEYRTSKIASDEDW